MPVYRSRYRCITIISAFCISDTAEMSTDIPRFNSIYVIHTKNLATD